jgi:uncharacterized repeat protein (TIGR01451 family)
VHYYLHPANDGPGPAHGVRLTATIPAGMTLSSVSTEQGSCSATGTSVECMIGTLPIGMGTTVEMVLIPTQPGAFTTTVTVSSATRDPNPDNNTDSQTTTVS